ncbi:MAG: glutamyl-tRNA reductase, partial [Nitrospirota bacterium]|nr:glutamyl-tRNA reductase [Nitrospirota bacterium]
IDNAFLFDIDDLEMRVEQNREERRREAVKAEGMIEEEVAASLQWLKSLDVTPTIVALRKRAEDIKQAEIDKAMARLGHLSTEERSAIEGLASAIVNKLLHGPLVTLKTEANSAGSSMYVEAAKRFFGLEAGPDAAALPAKRRPAKDEEGTAAPGRAPVVAMQQRDPGEPEHKRA